MGSSYPTPNYPHQLIASFYSQAVVVVMVVVAVESLTEVVLGRPLDAVGQYRQVVFAALLGGE